MTQTIAPETAIGMVALTVADLDRSIGFYRDRLGFQVQSQEDGKAILGAGERRLLELVETLGAKGTRKTTGLYHFAVLLPDRKSLARLLYELAEHDTPVQGAADHGVSEALYLADPDGNGIELYRDRRRSEWPTDDLGKLQMGTEELDIDDLVLELKDNLAPWQGLPGDTRIGHIHLHVRNLAEAEQFYTRVLGFQLMQRYGSGAIFVSAGGYHHHIGLNTWAGEGAPPPPAGSAGLRWFEVRLPDQGALEALSRRLQESGILLDAFEGGLLVRDPSQNAILFRV